MNTNDFLRKTAEDIISILTTPPTTTPPGLEAGDTTRNALLKITTILKRTDALPVIPSSSSQDNTEYPRVGTQLSHPTPQRTPSLHPETTPTSNIQAPPPRVVSPTPSHIHVPTYNRFTDK